MKTKPASQKPRYYVHSLLCSSKECLYSSLYSFSLSLTDNLQKNEFYNISDSCFVFLQTEKNPNEEEVEKDEERSRTRLRCCQGDSETPDDKPSDLVSLTMY